MNFPNKIPPFAPPGFTGSVSRENPEVAYLDAIRAKYGSTVYEIDRFAEVFQIADNAWAFHLTSPTPLTNMIYLIEGPEKALMIDTGYGVGNHKGLAEMLVNGKEVLCAVTHYHGDHTQGAHQWEEIYCHEYTKDVLEYQLSRGMGFWNPAPSTGRGWKLRNIFTEDDVVKCRPYKCIPLKNHDVINLGGDYDIEIIHMGGHAPGLSCYLDKKARRLYTGDAVFESLSPGLGIGLDLRATEYIPHAEFMDIDYFHEQIIALAARADEYDLTADGHCSIDSDKRVVSDLRDAIAAVKEDPYAYTDKITTIFGEGYIMQRGIANCRYSDPATVLDKPAEEK